jgi:type 2 lantibiotic biosynthesis protein LanM
MPSPLWASPAWLRALTLTERKDSLPGGGSLPPLTDERAKRAHRRARRWRFQFPFLPEDVFESLAATHGMQPETLVHLMAEPLQSLARRHRDKPAWLVDLEAASSGWTFESRGSHDASENVELSSFLNLAAPLIEQARGRLREGVQTLLEQYRDAPFEADTAVRLACASLPEVLLPVMRGTLALELNVRRIQGALEGATARARYQFFCEQLRDGDLAQSILCEYPVLARQLAERLHSWFAFQLEFLHRLCSDWHELRTTFVLTTDQARLSTVHWHKGDVHRFGRHVAVLEFSSGLRLVYKPKALTVDVHFQELLEWLNKRGAHPTLPTLRIVNRGTYGWAEFVPFRGCTSVDQVSRFYERQGAYLAIVHCLEATDLHLANLIANGEYPVLVDLETLFHPRVGGDPHGGDPASTVLQSSVLRVGMLPYRSFSNALDEGVDLSGLGGVAGQEVPFDVPIWEKLGTDEMHVKEGRLQTIGRGNRPTLDGRSIDLLDYANEFLRGFSAAWRLLREHRDELLAPGGPLERFLEDETRVVLRPTITYASLRQASYHPDVLRDAADRDVLLGWLRPAGERRLHPDPVLRAELEDLRNGDIPIFVTSPDSVDLKTSSGQCIPGYIREPAIGRVRRRMRDLSEAELERQVWIINATLSAATLSTERQQRPRSSSMGSAAATFNRDRLIRAACGIGRQLETNALRGDNGAVSWLGVSVGTKQRWSLAPAGIGLYDGLSGIALFLAYLASVAREPSFAELARDVLKMIRYKLTGAERHPLPIGAFDGLSGVMYLLTHLGCLWQDEKLLTEAVELAERLPNRVMNDRAFDLVSGSAGCLACVISLYGVMSSDRLLHTAVALGDHLLRHARPSDVGSAWVTHIPAWAPLTGFSHGASGIAWALLELSALTGITRFRAAALEAFRYERSCFSVAEQNWPDFRKLVVDREEFARGERKFGNGWCHGAPGSTLARLRALRNVDSPDLRDEIHSGLATTLRKGFGWSHSLCHGDLGNLEVLLQASEILGEERWDGEVEQVGASILPGEGTQGWEWGTPLGVESPGLMTGLAGVGFGLIRTAHPARVPSVLVLDPPRTA